MQERKEHRTESQKTSVHVSSEKVSGRELTKMFRHQCHLGYWQTGTFFMFFCFPNFIHVFIYTYRHTGPSLNLEIICVYTYIFKRVIWCSLAAISLETCNKLVDNVLTDLFSHVAVVWLLSHVQFFVTPWTAAHQGSLSSIHCLLELAQVHVYWVGDAIQPSHPLLPSSLFAFNSSQHRGLF